MARKSRQIKWMPAYKASDDRIIDHYQVAFKDCDRRRAASLFFQDQNEYRKNPSTSRIQYDKETDTWRGREVYLPREKFGLRRDGDDPNSLRNKLIPNIGILYLSGAEIRALFVSLFGETDAENKFNQARNPKRNMLKFDKKTRLWHWWTTQPPDQKDFGPDTACTKKRAEYIRVYGSMPRGKKNKPGDKYVAEDSQVLKWMGEQSGSTDLKWLEAERDRAFKAGALKFDKDTGETVGILTYQAEQKANQKAESVAKPETKGKPFVFTEDMKQTITGLGPRSNEDVWEVTVAKICGLDPDSSKLPTALATALELGLWKSGIALNKTTGEEDTVSAGKEWWEKREAKKLEEERQEAERRKAEEERRRVRQEQEDEQYRQREEKLEPVAAPLKDLPPMNTEYVNNWIRSHCDTSIFDEMTIFHYAGNHGFIIFKRGVACGANHQPATEPE